MLFGVCMGTNSRPEYCPSPTSDGGITIIYAECTILILQYLSGVSPLLPLTPHPLLPPAGPAAASRKAAAVFPASQDGVVPPLSSPRGGHAVGKKECEMYVSVCDATGVFSILGMFLEEEGGKDKANGSSSRLCNLMVKLGKARLFPCGWSVGWSTVGRRRRSLRRESVLTLVSIDPCVCGVG